MNVVIEDKLDSKTDSVSNTQEEEELSDDDS